MKYCPHCHTSYSDETLRFCLQDGSVLVGEKAASSTAAVEPETVVRQRPASENRPPPPLPPTNPAPRNDGGEIRAPKKSNTALIVFLTALVTLLLAGGAIGLWLLSRSDGKNDVARNSNADSINTRSSKPINANSFNANVNAASNASNANANVNANRVILVNAASPAAPKNDAVDSETPAPTPAFDAERIQSEVSDSVTNWTSAHESGDISGLMGNYGDRLDYYYNSRNVGVGAVRGDKRRAFELYDDIRMKISNLRVTPDEGGERATAVFDKEWEFEGSGGDRRSAGKVQSQLQLTKIGNRWRITGERDLRTYYIEQ